MSGTSARRIGAQPFLVAASLVVILAGLRAAAELILPLLVAVFLALLSLPLLRWLRSHGARLWLAVLVTFLADVLLLAGFVFLLVGAVMDLAEVAPIYLEKLFLKAQAVLSRLDARGLPVGQWFALERLEEGRLLDMAGKVLRQTVTGAASLLSYLILVLLTTVFLLAEGARFRAKLQAALGGRRYDPRRLLQATREIQHYLGIKTLVSAAMGLLMGGWVGVTGVDYAVLWAILAFLLHYIPMVGGFVAAIPPILLALVQYGGGRAALVALGYLVANTVLGNVVEPALMGRRFGLSTLVVFLSLAFWGWLWGPVGMFLSVPLTMVLKILCEHTSNLRWIAVLLGSVPEQASGQDLPAGDPEPAEAEPAPAPR